MGFDHRSRLDRLRELMRSGGYDTVLLSVGSDLPYFTGYEAMATERLTMLVVPADGDPVMFIPRLEAPRVSPGVFEVVPWDETDDPVRLVAERVTGAGRIAIGDHTWSVFLLALQDHLAGTRWDRASSLTSQLRMRKDPEEIEALRAAGHGVDRVMSRIPSEVRFSGRTELDVSRDLARMTIEEGHEVSSFTIVASGPNGASPHHETGQRVLQPGDLVVCDFGGRVDGYFSDSTRTFSVGEPDARQTEVHGLVAAANAAARSAVEVGLSCQEVDRAARKVITDGGYGEYFIHRTGHGIGLETHEHPYMVEGNDLPLERGMAFSIEPGIYLPGEFGVRIEDIVVCGDEGADELNLSSRELVAVE